MIKADGNTQILTGFCPALKETWFFDNATQGQLEGMIWHWNASARLPQPWVRRNSVG
jgi:hypothetical protein